MPPAETRRAATPDNLGRAASLRGLRDHTKEENGMAVYGTFVSATGEELEKALWPIDRAPKGVVQFVHGMAGAHPAL